MGQNGGSSAEGSAGEVSAASSIPVAAQAFRLRPGTPDDHHYVFSTWRRSEAEASAHLEGRHFGPWQDRMMDAILARPLVTLTVASPLEDDGIAGWSVIAPPVLFFVYVAPDARRLGLARMLLSGLLDCPSVIYVSRPARVKDAAGRWQNSMLPIPRAWKYMPRAAFYEVT
jgi:GNAT superfamily N-acetyltransferase